MKLSKFALVLLFIAGVFLLNMSFADEHSVDQKLVARVLDQEEDLRTGQDVRDIVIPPSSQKAKEGIVEDGENIFEVDSYFRYLPKSNAKHTDGDIEMTESEIEYTLKLKAFGKLPIDISLDTQYVGIKNQLSAFQLPNRLTGFAFDIDTKLPLFIFENWYAGIGISPSWYTDNWGFQSSAFRIPSRYYAIYRPDDKLTIIGGIAIYPDYQSTISPIFGVIYKFNDKLAFNIIPPRPNISYALTDKINLFGELNITNSEFEVSRGGQEGVVLRYKEVNLGGGIKYKFNKYIEANISGGGVFNRYFYYRDGGGKRSVDNGGYAEFRIIGRI
ncbi:MAG: DUF6268 family outer membrane beta-barrel protein [Candidatus Omnitrophota bacterium]